MKKISAIGIALCLIGVVNRAAKVKKLEKACSTAAIQAVFRLIK